MKQSNILTTAAMLITAGSLLAQAPAELRCEHLASPLGVDCPNPRLSWRIDDRRQDARQTAYQLVVGVDSLEVLRGMGKVWQSERRETDDIMTIYAGQRLEAFTRYFWQVKVWDKDGLPATSPVASFETGLMTRWQGAWISDRHGIAERKAPYFRKTFEATKTIQSARAYVAVAGLYELLVNGQKVGNHRLDPAYTRFDRRNLYVTHDLTALLQQGRNAIGLILGNGWYNHQSVAVWDFDRAPWRNRPAFCLDLRIAYTDGSTETIKSDLDWKTSFGPIVFNSIYTAEHYDARLEQKDWCMAAFDDAKWGGVMYRSAPSERLVAQQLHPIRDAEMLPASTVKKLNDTTYVFDFARNMAGVTHIKVSGEKGAILRLKHAERLHANGHADLSNIDVYHRPTDNTDPFQTDIVVLSGGDDEFMAMFGYKGFRYVEVGSSRPLQLDKGSLVAYFRHSDVPKAGDIRSSSELVNKLCQASNNAYLSNLMGYPTDCPQREKNGWTGDGHLAIETALYGYDGITVYEKWLADHRDEQQPNGVLPDIIPTGGWGYGIDNGVDWTSTIALIPWNLYLFYGDSKALYDCYENIKRYVDYIDRRSPQGLTSWGRGDWVPVRSRSSLELTSSVYFYADALILSRAAKLFNRPNDSEHYTILSEKIRSAINAKYLNRETGIYANGSQTELSVPLYWGVVPPEMVAKVAGNLAKRVERAGFHLDVGVLGAKAILSALSENGYAEAAYKVATQDTYPSWGWWIVNGATTLLENWDLQATRDISDNHMMFGEVVGWLYKGIGGIKPDPLQPGFKHIILSPHFASGLTRFEARHRSPYGEIVSKWERRGKQIIYTVCVPANSVATLYLRGKVLELGAGEREFIVNSL
jgi:alpha-L-rhamnosidase